MESRGGRPAMYAGGMQRIQACEFEAKRTCMAVKTGPSSLGPERVPLLNLPKRAAKPKPASPNLACEKFRSPHIPEC